jgi:hypothetical protein
LRTIEMWLSVMQSLAWKRVRAFDCSYRCLADRTRDRSTADHGETWPFGVRLGDSHKTRSVARDVRRILLKNMKRTNVPPARPAQWQCKPITLIEVCCSRASKFALSVVRHGGAAIRVTWPPSGSCVRKWHQRWVNEWRPTEDIQRRFLKKSGIENGPNGWSTKNSDLEEGPAGPYTRCWRNRTWHLNIDWPVHQRALLERVQKISAVPPSKVAVLHTSPECRMFSSAQFINVAKGCYSSTDHQRAMARLAYIRQLHAAWLRCRRRKRGRKISLHEQPPKARVDWCRTKKTHRKAPHR